MVIRGSRPHLLGLVGGLLALVACATAPPLSSSFDLDAAGDAAIVPVSNDGSGADSTSLIAFGDDAPRQLPGDGCAADGCEAGADYCGDGVVTAPEACDDGNARPGDGCSGTCQIEPGWACPAPGQACVKVWVCGNGHVDPGEQCDDGNVLSGDGCSSTCQVEPGYACPNSNGVGGSCITLKANACGDGIVAGTEQCDDGNTVSGDGCSSTCLLEPGFTCPAQGTVCKKIEYCGNGVVELDIGEQCDDGNTLSGDGCSSLCQVELGFICATPGQPCVSTVKCGDGRVGGNETCDDGNTVSGDGCSSTCRVEPGWVCPSPGAKCVDRACGDGIVAGSEQCDDGNTSSGDGCSATCQIEPGFACVTSMTPSGAADAGADAGTAPPASVCHKTTCGDGIKEGSEECDDSNLIPYDGCSPICTIEPKCNGLGQCTSVCGDGLVEPPEQCDLGALNGTHQGCSASCRLEISSGWTCVNAPQPPSPTLVIPILYRDMLYWDTTTLANPPIPSPPAGGHPDFNCGPGHCGANGTADAVSLGEVQARLGADGKPAFAFVGNPQTLTDPVSFCWWYHDAGCGDGGANPYAKLVYLDAARNPTTLTLAQGASGTYTYSNKQFFPIDGLGWNAGANPQLTTDCESMWTPGVTSTLRNFSFTSELHYIFTYQASIAASAAPAVFNFTGDDDVWGFINNQIVIDLGGVHSPSSGSFALNTANAAALGLVDGGWYSIDLFQAEAHVCRSTYALTLSNFAHVVTQCQTVCGDGIVEGNEQCDQGATNGVNACSACTANCTLGPYCGDGVSETQCGEQCDDGLNLTTYGGLLKVCGPGCRFAPYCGDGTVSNGEQCDEGALNGSGYGHCGAGCKLGPRCGDGIVQGPPEQCDEGVLNGTSGSRCDASCLLKCGDGMLDPGEQCDLGAAKNVGGYGGCNADCSLAPYCGDAVLQNPPEQCDYGTANNTGGYGGCNKDCTLGAYCGDGVVQNPPEECDNGATNVVPAASYGMGVCTTACVPAPYCGDGIVQQQFGEQCDGTPGCSVTCQPLPAK